MPKGSDNTVSAPINNVSSDHHLQLTEHAHRMGPARVREAVALITDTSRYVERNANAQIAVETMAFRLMSLGRG